MTNEEREVIHQFDDLTHYQPPGGFSDEEDDSVVDLDAEKAEDMIRKAERGFRGEDDGDETKSASEEDDFDDDDNLTERMRKRLRRERAKHDRETEELREQLRAGEERLSRVEQQLTESQKRSIQRDRKREAEKELASLEADLAEAIEEGDSAKQASLQRQMQQIAAKSTMDVDDIDDEGDSSARHKSTSQDDKPLLNNWLRENSHWYGKDGKRRETRELQLIQDDLLDEGYQPETRAFFDELVARHSKKYPNLIRDLDGRTRGTVDDDLSDEEEDRQARSRGRRRPVEPEETDRGGNRRTRGKRPREYVLTREDKTQMRTFGLNPDDPKAVKHFVNEKLKSA